MREIYIFLILIIVTGCTAPKSYILERTQVPILDKNFTKSIGIKTIELPQYLLGKEIPFLQKDNQIIYLNDKKWATYLDEHLTNRLISTLQKAFNTPKVYNYPLNTSTKPDIILQITINKFIADKDNVTLNATCSSAKKDKLISIKKPIKSKKDIINGMNRAFTTLEKKIIDDCANIKTKE